MEDSKVIAIDFDGTIVEDKFPEVGKTKPRALLGIKKLIREARVKSVRKWWRIYKISPLLPC